MSEDRAKQLAYIVRGLERLENEKAEYLTDWKHRREVLANSLAAIAGDVLSGQGTLTEAFEKVAEEINAGSLDKDGIKVTASVGKRA